MTGAETSIDLNLPVTPNVLDPEMFQELMIIYNAIRSLAVGIDDQTEAGELSIHMQLLAAIASSQITQLRRELSELREELEGYKTNWGQPGELGNNIPNVVNATNVNAENVNVTSTVTTVDVKTTTLSATGNSSLTDTTVKKLGVNGNSASGKLTLPANATDLPTAITLVNALKNLTSTFGFST